MLQTKQQEVVSFIVCPQAPGRYDVFEQGFEMPIAEFDDMDTAEKYALRLAETKPLWTVDTYDASGNWVGTYNSDDDSMPRPALD